MRLWVCWSLGCVLMAVVVVARCPCEISGPCVNDVVYGGNTCTLFRSPSLIFSMARGGVNYSGSLSNISADAWSGVAGGLYAEAWYDGQWWSDMCTDGTCANWWGGGSGHTAACTNNSVSWTETDDGLPATWNLAWQGTGVTNCPPCSGVSTNVFTAHVTFASYEDLGNVAITGLVWTTGCYGHNNYTNECMYFSDSMCEAYGTAFVVGRSQSWEYQLLLVRCGGGQWSCEAHLQPGSGFAWWATGSVSNGCRVFDDPGGVSGLTVGSGGVVSGTFGLIGIAGYGGPGATVTIP